MKTEKMRLRSLLLLIAPSVWLACWGSSYAQSPRAAPSPGSLPRFPYQAIVLAEQAEVRSGPAKVHYATDRLAQGSVVEVYRHDPGGWCAIRPPRGSFSLIPEGGLEVDDDQVARVAEDGVQAWVGTRLGAVERPLWQVKLRAGEVVQVLGQVSWPAPEGHSVVWYQIAPPPGEFRWIHISDLQLPDEWTDLPEIAANDPGSTSPDDGAAGSTERLITMPGTTAAQSTRSLDVQPPSVPPPPVQPNAIVGVTPNPPDLALGANPARGDVEVRSANLDRPLEARRDEGIRPANLQVPGSTSATAPPRTDLAESINQGWRRATRPIQLVGADEPIDSIAGTDSAATQSLSQLPLHSGPADPSVGGPTVPAPAGADRWNEAVRVADVSPAIPDIHRQSLPGEMTARNPVTADGSEPTERSLLPPLGSLSQRLTQLELMLTQELLRPLGRWRLEPIAQYARSIQAQPLGPDEQVQVERLLIKLADCQRLQQRSANVATHTPIDTTTAVGSGVDASVQLGTTYDAYGWLNELVQANGTRPPTYVLQDDNGKIIFHVSPSPGLNLHRYLKQKVGIIGQRGYHKRYRLDHVTAERVVVLQPSR